MTTTFTDADFDRLSWHDCCAWRFALHVGEPERDDWTSDFVIDLDYILEWLCPVAGGAVQFRVAPATLTFHGVTDPRFVIDCGDSGFQVSLHEVSIDRVARERLVEQKVYLDRPYYRWTIRLNWPQGGEISFGAAGFTQRLLSEPILSDRQCLSPSERRRLTLA